MIILVTGGAGFIGSNFLFYELNKHPEDRFICLDNLTYAGNIITLKSILNNKNFRFVKGDISHKSTVELLFEQEAPDVVVNFAAESHVDRSIKNPENFLKTNIIGTQILMDACRKYGIKRFHQISTDEVYGDLPLNKPNLSFTEKASISSSSPYSASKAAADLLVLSYHKTYGLPVSITRSSNNYGPYQFPEKLIPRVISRAICNETIPVYGNGENIRDWIFVNDNCSAIDLVIRKGRIGEVYNIGGNSEKNNLEVVRFILKELNKPESLITYVKDRSGHDKRYAVDATKIYKDIGWFPTTDFRFGIKTTVKWYQNNRSWWECSAI